MQKYIFILYLVFYVNYDSFSAFYSNFIGIFALDIIQ